MLSIFSSFLSSLIITGLLFFPEAALVVETQDQVNFPVSSFYEENSTSSYIIPKTILHAAAPIETNEMGRIPILEYHNIGYNESRWMRSIENFKKDLEWLYINDYFLLSVEDYVRSYFPVPYDRKPVVLTFDDGRFNHFNYRSDGSIDPDCAVGILDDFYQKHPDFGSAAVFYLNANPFGQPDLIVKKIEYLYKTGRQIGYHTLSHIDFRGISVNVALGVLEKQWEQFETFFSDEMTITTLAYPYGWVPAGDLNFLSPLVSVGFLIGADPAYPLYHQKANAYRTPRIQAIDEEWLRHFGRDPGEISHLEKRERFEVFVSDGLY